MFFVLGNTPPTFWDKPIDDLLLAATPQDVIELQFSFAAMGLAAMAAALWPALRSIASLIGPIGGARTAFIRVIAGQSILLAALFPLFLMGEKAQPNLPVTEMILWLPLAIAGLIIQTGSEELVFRGFIGQQLAARFSSPLVWIVLPAILFGSLHYDKETYGEHAYLAVISTTLFAMAASDLTARTGNLGAAIALHFANNFFVMVLIGNTGDMDGLALYTQPMDLGNPVTIATDTVSTVLMWLTARIALRI